MHRRNLLQSLAAAASGVLASATASRAVTAPASEAPAAPANDVPRVVYHLSDIEKAQFVLGNMRNHVKGMGGPDKVRLALVVHGPALRAFRADSGDARLLADARGIMDDGAAFHACGNTMKGMEIGLADLVPGFLVAADGGVVALAQMQAAGWLYLRP